MAVRFNEPGDGEVAAEVDDLCVRTNVPLDVGVGPEGRDVAAGDGERLGARTRRIHRHDRAVAEDHIGGWYAGGAGGCEERQSEGSEGAGVRRRLNHEECEKVAVNQDSDTVHLTCPQTLLLAISPPVQRIERWMVTQRAVGSTLRIASVGLPSGD